MSEKIADRMIKTPFKRIAPTSKTDIDKLIRDKKVKVVGREKYKNKSPLKYLKEIRGLITSKKLK